MPRLPVEYAREPEGGAQFEMASPETQMSSNPLSQAAAYGFTLLLPFNLSVNLKGAIIEQDGTTTEIKPGEEGFIVVYLGLRLAVPPETAFINLAKIQMAEDYVIDGKFKEQLGRSWYKVNLYFSIEKLQEPITWYFSKGTPVIKVVPVPDWDYEFVYKRAVWTK